MLSGQYEEVQKPFSFCSDTMSFINFVKVQRNLDLEYVTHIGFDNSEGSIKVTLNLVFFSCCEESLTSTSS